MSLSNVIRHTIHCSVLSFSVLSNFTRYFLQQIIRDISQFIFNKTRGFTHKREVLTYYHENVSVCLKNIYTAHWPSCVRTLAQQYFLLLRIKICLKEHFNVTFLDKEVFSSCGKVLLRLLFHCYDICFIFRQGAFAQLVQKCYFDFVSLI